MPRSVGSIPALLIAALLTPTGFQLAAQTPTGTIIGRVSDSTGAPILGAVVSLRGSRSVATVDASGRYAFRAVAPGTYTVIARSLGFAMDSDVVTVTQGSATQDLMLRAAATVLAAVEVRASPRLNETRIAALDRRRTADNIVSGLSGDEIRSLPNANAAEAAARIPGVSTERDEGEGKFVQIRGTEPRLSNVAVDGVHIPGTEEGDRIPKLDDIPSDLLGAVQVSKTLTADMDADAIGGSINLITKTPEGAPRGYVAGQFGQSTLLSHRQGQGGFAYGGRFGPAGRVRPLVGGAGGQNDHGREEEEAPPRAGGPARPLDRRLGRQERPGDQRRRARLVGGCQRPVVSGRMGSARLRLLPHPVRRGRHRRLPLRGRRQRVPARPVEPVQQLGHALPLGRRHGG